MTGRLIENALAGVMCQAYLKELSIAIPAIFLAFASPPEDTAVNILGVQL